MALRVFQTNRLRHVSQIFRLRTKTKRNVHLYSVKDILKLLPRVVCTVQFNNYYFSHIEFLGFTD